jgi:hypothetical protein
MPKDPIREKFTKLRQDARKLAAEYFERYPKDHYLTEVEGWRHLQSDNIEFTIKRLSLLYVDALPAWRGKDRVSRIGFPRSCP